MILALVLSALSGWVALSYEIVWYRMLSFATRGLASSFGLLLAAYLLGLAAGALLAERLLRGPSPLLRSLGRYVLVSSALSYLVVPAASLIMTLESFSWIATLPLVAVAAAGQGTVFPLLAEASVRSDERVGERVSWLYAANIAGSVGGTLVTGALLTDLLSVRSLSLVLLAGGAAVAFLASRRDGERPIFLLAGGAAVVLLAAASGALFDRLYERLQWKENDRPSRRFAHVVETRSGVITVEEDGTLYGGGIYDGAYNTDPRQGGNEILRAYAAAGLHPAPRDVLIIGLSSGSWATVLAGMPGVERLTAVEINPGYVGLLSKYPPVAGLLTNPKVRIEVEDGRRWLVRNSRARFDLIVANVWNWRAGSSNLLSKEFLGIVRSRLKEGGVFFYNTTGSARVLRTGLDAFPQALRIGSFLALSDGPLQLDLAAVRAALEHARTPEGPCFAGEGGAAALERCLKTISGYPVSREKLEAAAAGAAPITDDNMGTEWEQPFP